MATAVELKDVSFSYQPSAEGVDSNVLKHVSFQVEEGEYVALIGHNGSGKSTVAKIIVGILNPDKDVLIFGEKMADDNVYRLQKQIGLVFQNPDNQFIGATVRDDIAFGLENDCVPTEKMGPLIEEYAAKVGMAGFLDREPSNLSGGQKQRVAIAGTLIRRPRILLLDEATSMLDPKGRREIRSLIDQMKRENSNLTIISITHDIEEAYQADRVIILNQGAVEAAGTPAEVFADSERLRAIDLEIPFFLRLKAELAKRGLEIGDAHSIEGLVKTLCR